MTPATDWATRDLPRHTVSEVARYTGLAQPTIRRWLKPAGRPIRASHLDLMELAVVGAWMREWPERDRRTGMAFRIAARNHDYLAAKLGTRHPYATEGAFAGRGCAFDVTLDTEIVDKVLPTLGAICSNFPAFDYSTNLVVRWYPRGRDNPVIIDARYGFGSPTVGGVNTWVLAGSARAGESVEDIAEEYDLTAEEVRAALEFEGVEAKS